MQVVREAVARALAEDLTPLGDLTSALLPPGIEAVADFVPRREGVLAGTSCATEAFAQVDSTGRGRVVGGRWRRGRRGQGRRHGARPAGADPDGRADRAQLPLPPLGHRHAHASVRRRRRIARRHRSRLGHAQDHAGTPRPREGGRPRRRGGQPSRQPVRLGHVQGQPPRGARDRRRRAIGARPLAWPARARRGDDARPGAGGARRRCRRAAARQHGARRRARRGRARRRLGRVGRRPAPAAARVLGRHHDRERRRLRGTGVDLLSTSQITQSAPALDIGLDIR